MYLVIVRHGCAYKTQPRVTRAACTIHTVLYTMIDVHRLYVPFLLLGVVGVDLRPDTSYVNISVY
jgi:hypothetical protein